MDERSARSLLQVQLKYRAPFTPLVPGVTFVKFNDLDDLQRKFDVERLRGLHRNDSG